jgi:hydroxyacylglutathione hydrolase
MRLITKWMAVTTVAIALLGVSGGYTAEPVAGTFPAKWNDGTECATEPPIQVHAYNPDLYILRQSLCTSFEGPFMYLIFGADRALLYDTGAGGIPLADVVGSIIRRWLHENGKASIELVISHSHSHGDHVTGDRQFDSWPLTTIIGWTVPEVVHFFGITRWPEQTSTLNLGERILDVIPIPGHQEAHIALYDRRTGLLLTGDTLYPGRLYFSPANFRQFLDSVERLAAFIEGRRSTWVLGAHIEISNRPGQDFPIGSKRHPNEHRLELTGTHLLELRDALRAMQAQGAPRREIRDDFIIYPLF